MQLTPEDIAKLQTKQLAKIIRKLNSRKTLTAREQAALGGTFAALKTSCSQFPARAARFVKDFRDEGEIEDRLRDEMEAATTRGADLGLNDDEITFYDALVINGSAVQTMGNDKLKARARLGWEDCVTRVALLALLPECTLVGIVWSGGVTRSSFDHPLQAVTPSVSGMEVEERRFVGRVSQRGR